MRLEGNVRKIFHKATFTREELVGEIRSAMDAPACAPRRGRPGGMRARLPARRNGSGSPHLSASHTLRRGGFAPRSPSPPAGSPAARDSAAPAAGFLRRARPR